jgi:transcriptional regulator with XRE-family HTH domain/tetratricopeptide (TPR) repeat protein
MGQRVTGDPSSAGCVPTAEEGPITEQPGFAELLRRRRHAARLTLEQLAEASGVSARTLSDMERGRSRGPQHRTVAAIADALALDDSVRKQFIDLAREGRLRDHWTRPTGLCELPPAVLDFTGRDAELAWTNDLVAADDPSAGGGVGLITGPAGLGKTTFAVRAAHLLRPGFPGGVLFLDLFGMSQQPVTAENALGLLLRALGVADQQIPKDIAERASLYRSLLRGRRILVVLDNAASEEQVRPLLPTAGAGWALVTSRRSLAGLEGVRRLSLGPLPLLDSAELLTGILGDRGALDGGPALAGLARLCGGLPLALRIVGNRLVSRPGWSAADLAARLTDEERRLDRLSAGDLKIATAFGLSYEQLADSARRLFRRLALVPGHDFDAALAAVVAGTSTEDAWDDLDELVDLGLLQDSGSARHRFHDLVRLFARNRLDEEETEADRNALSATTTSWLLRMAADAGRWFEPDGHPDADADLAAFSSSVEADRWLRVEVDNWLGALRLAASSLPALVLECADSMHWFSDRWMHGPHWKEVFTLGAEAAAALGRPAQQAAQLNNLAWVHTVPPDDPEAALRYATRARELATETGESEQVAWAFQNASVALRRLRRLREAAASSSQAAELFRERGDINAYCQTLGTFGDCLRDDGRLDEALAQYQRMCDLAADPESGMTPSIAAISRAQALSRVGQSLALLDRRAEATTTLTEAVSLMDQLRWTNNTQARVLEILAGVLADEGRADESGRAYERAAEVFDAIGNADAARRCRDSAV